MKEITVTTPRKPTRKSSASVKTKRTSASDKPTQLMKTTPKVKTSSADHRLIWEHFSSNARQVPVHTSWRQPIGSNERSFLYGVLVGSMLVMTIVLYFLI